MAEPFTVSSTVVLTSTTSSQTTAVPAGGSSIIVYNGGANVVYLTFAATVAVPTTGTWTPNVIAAQPETTQSFGISRDGGTLAYIASTAGGLLVLSVGSGA